MYEGLWWLHTPGVVPFLTLVNTSVISTTVHIVVSDSTNSSSRAEDVTVGPKEVQLVTLGGLIHQLPVSSKSGGIELSFPGRDGALSIEGGMEDFSAGYSAAIPLLSINAKHLRHLVSETKTVFAATGVQLGKPEARMQFPVGTNFIPYATLRNLRDVSTQVTVEVSYMDQGAHKVGLGSLALAAHETSQLDLLSLLHQAGLATFSGEANFTFGVDGGGDSLLVAVGSTAKDASYVFSVDPMILVPETGKIFCDWEVSGKTDTMFSFWNSGSVAEDGELVLFYPRGTYRLPIHLDSNESRSVDLSSIISSRLPDADGHVIPVTVKEESARLINARGRRKPMEIRAHAAVFNVETATCREPCPLCDNVVYVLLTPSNEGVLVGGSQQYVVTATDKSGDQWDDSLNTTWSTDNSSVATMSGQNATGMTEGTANVQAVVRDTGVPSWKDGSLCNYPFPQCPVYVGRPTAPIGVGLSIGVSNFQYQSISGGICYYLLSCPNGNQNASCQAGTFQKAAPCPYDYISNSYVVVRKGTTKQCFGFGKATESTSPKNCT